MRKIALLLSLVLFLSACGGGAEESPAAASVPPGEENVGVGRNDPTAPPTPWEEGPAESGSPSSEVKNTPDDPAGTPTTSPVSPSDALAEPSASPSDTVAEPSVSPSDATEPSADPVETSTPAGMVAGADYDFSQPVPETAAVSEDYFADAAMIGDSRIEGFQMFSGLTQGAYMAHTGLMIFEVFDTPIKFQGEKMTVPEALDKGTYGKVYISLGVNELGMYDDQGYHDHFAEFVDLVREKQPDATIYIQLLIPVNTQKCKDKGQADYVTNEQIGVYNDLLYQVAQEKEVFLVDPAQAIVDETGEPPYDLTADGVHFQPEGYQLWYDYLTKHTVDKGEHR